MGKISAYAFLVFFLLILYTLFFKEFVFVSLPNKSDDVPDFVFHDISISHFTDGVLDMEVSANRAVINRGESDIFFDQSKGVSFFGESFLRFNADSSSMDLETGSMRLSHAYLVFSYLDELYWLHSDDITWVASDNMILSNSLTEISNSRFRVMADSMSWDTLNQRLVFKDYPKIFLRASYAN